jgi:hypothetical protein
LLLLLRRRRIGSELRIGVRRQGTSIRAHAWVEVDGTPANDSADHVALFASIPNLPDAAPAVLLPSTGI